MRDDYVMGATLKDWDKHENNANEEDNDSDVESKPVKLQSKNKRIKK